jgi:hypothetical protein
MKLLLCLDPLHQTVLKQVQNYVVRNHLLKMDQIQGAMAMTMTAAVVEMATKTETEKMIQTETGTIKAVLMVMAANPLTIAHSLIDINDHSSH